MGLAFYSLVLRYRAALFFKRLFAPLFSSHCSLSNAPAVTVCIVNTNNRFPLELALRSLAKTISYPNYSILAVDNNSKDGSLELLDSLKSELPLKVIARSKPLRQAEAYEFFLRNVETKYWVCVHEDMLFLAKGWLEDLVNRMEPNPNLFLLECERVPERAAFDPNVGKKIRVAEALSSWLCCFRTSLREKVDKGFFEDGPVPGKDGIPFVFEVGAKLVGEMKSRKLSYAAMPFWFRLKWHHFGCLSWWRNVKGASADWKRFKQCQQRHISGLCKVI